MCAFQYVIPLSISWAVNARFFLFTNAKNKERKMYIFKHFDLFMPGALPGCIGGDKKLLIGLSIAAVWSPSDPETVKTIQRQGKKERHRWMQIKPLRKWRRRALGRDRDADRWCHFCLGGSFEVECRRISREKRKWPHAGWSFWGHGVCPCLPCPQRGPRRTFWSGWPPRRQPQNLPLLNFHAIGWKLFNIYLPIDVYF